MNVSTIPEILDAWAKYTEYDPEQRSFNLMSNNYAMHKVGQTVQSLLEWDPTGAIPMIYLQSSMDSFYEKATFNAKQVLDDPSTIEEDLAMYRLLHSDAANEATTDTIEMLDALDRAMNPIPRLTGEQQGPPDPVADVAEIADKLSTDLKKLRLSVWKRSDEPIALQTNITNTIHIFPSLRDGIEAMLNVEDCCALCYIDQPSSADAWFGIFIKSNGNLISFDERLSERYPGAHHRHRNGRYLEDHAFNIFPYDDIFDYGKHDYKGYATEYTIDEEMLSMASMRAETRLTLALTMMLVQKKVEGVVLDQEELLIDSMMPENRMLETGGSTELMVVEQGMLARHEDALSRIISELDAKTIIEGDTIASRLKDEYGPGCTLLKSKSPFIELYGEGFTPDYSELFLSNTHALPDPLTPDEIRNNEFVGTYSTLRTIAYARLRGQLAEHIKDRMWADFESDGGPNTFLKALKRAVKDNADALYRLATCVWVNNRIGDYHGDGRRLYNSIPRRVEGLPGIWEMVSMQGRDASSVVTPNETFDKVVRKDSWGRDVIEHKFRDPYYPDTQATIAFRLEFMNAEEIEFTLGMELPRWMRAWANPDRSDNGRPYAGNHILDITDPIADLKTPYEGYDRYGKRDYKNSPGREMTVWIALSKRSLKKLAKEMDLPIPDMVARFEH